MLKRMRVALLLLLFIPCLGEQTSKGVFIAGGYLRAEEFNDLRAIEREAYAMGFVNGVMGSTLLEADENEVNMLHECIRGMDSGQVAAIMERYIKDHPEKWRQQLTPSSLFALLDICPDLKKLAQSRHTVVQ